MNKSIVVLLLAGFGLALFVGGTTGWLLGGLTLIAAILFVTLRGYFPARQAGTAIGNLVAPSVGTGFAQQAQTTTDGEVLLPYQTYKKIHRRLTVSLWTMFVLMVVTLVGLRTLPVPTTVLLLPALGIYLALAVYSALSLVVLVPSGQRLATVRTLFLADPRLVFAQYAAHRPNGEVTVGYTTYKRLTKATGYVLATLLIAVLIVLTSEVQQARVASQANVAAANQQFQELANHLLAGQGDLKEQVGALLAQSLQPAPTIDEKSLTQRVLSAVSKNLPPPPVPIVRDTFTEQTKIVNQNFIAPNSTQPVTIGAGSSLAYKDDRGTTFLTIGTGPTVTIPDGGTLNIQGGWQIDGTPVTATATDLNTTSNLDNADQGNEGARYVNSRAADFTNFSPSRDDVQAALSAIDTAVGTINTSISSTGAAAAPVSGAYVTIGNNGTLTSERALTAGTGLTLTDGGANGSATLAIDSTVATLTGSQTLTNKTLTSPIIATISNTGTLTLPTITDTLVGRATTDTLTNKTLTSPAINSPTISGGTIDNAAVGGTTAAGGKFTTLSSTGATVLATSSGNVGIGTTNPSQLLEVEKNAASGYLFLGGVTGGAQVDFYADGNAGYVETKSNYPLWFGTNDSAVQMSLDTTGNVGIGVTSAAGKLQVSGSSYFATTSGNVGIGTTAASAKFQVGATSGAGTGGVYIGGGSGFGLAIDTSGSNNAYVYPTADALNIGFSPSLATPGAPKVTILSGGNVGIGVTNPLFKLDVTGSARVTGQTTSTDGFVEKIIAGACVDGSFTTATNGLLCLDSTDGRLYFRYGGAWHYAAQTAGFQIPSILNEHTGLNETAGLKPGDFVIGQLNDRFDDSALHGVYVKFDLETELTKLLTANPKLLSQMLTSSSVGLTTTELKNVLVSGDVTVVGNLTVKGTLTVSKQQAGFAVIPKDGKEVAVTFSSKFADTPVINASPHDGWEGGWSILRDTGIGFTIHLARTAKSNVRFSWTATAVDDPTTSKGTVGSPTPEPSPTDMPTPTPDVTPSATPDATPSPTPSATATPSPTPSATPEPSGTPTPSPTDSPVASPTPTP